MSIGKYHNISVEDDVTIYGEYENGASATFISTTGELPGTNRLEISGDLGKIVVEEGKLKWWKLATPERDVCFAETKGFHSPEITYSEFDDTLVAGHTTVLEAFAEAILDGGDLIADGREGLNSLYLSNAAYISAWTDSWAEIPTDEDLFEKYLTELCLSENKKDTKTATPESEDSLKERWTVRW